MYRFKGKMQNGQSFKGSAPAAKNFVEANETALETVKTNLTTDAGKVVDFRVWFEDTSSAFLLQKKRVKKSETETKTEAAPETKIGKK